VLRPSQAVIVAHNHLRGVSTVPGDCQVVLDDAKVFNDKFQEWEDYHNYHRPHGARDGQTPYERLRQKTQTRP
jgi:transposase InsO family protein